MRRAARTEHRRCGPPGNNGPLVLEVNSSPGLVQDAEKASGVNVAGAIVDYVMEDTAFSEVDIGQLLRTVPGSGVLTTTAQPPKDGREATGRGLCLNPVFALSRATALVWNPTMTCNPRYDDVLVCYGELTELRASLRQAMLGVPREALMFDRTGDGPSKPKSETPLRGSGRSGAVFSFAVNKITYSNWKNPPRRMRATSSITSVPVARFLLLALVGNFPVYCIGRVFCFSLPT